MPKMPTLFIGHGSPMNAVETNEFTRGWKEIAAQIPKPKAILSVSAHWYTDSTRIMDNTYPKMIYDMYGFPKELYEIVYPAPGAPALAQQTHSLLHGRAVLDSSWGFDHGTWSVLHVMYPKADIPVFQLSVDSKAKPEAHYKIGQQISSLREQGVLILGSGNVVHNLAKVNFDMEDGFGWANEFDGYINDAIVNHEHNKVIDYKRAGDCARMAFPTPDHFYPLLTVLGAADESSRVSAFNNQCVMGSMSMTSYLIE
jgi:4,5-DOPA dioxygenase extradiol